MPKQTHLSLLAALHGHPFAITEAGLAMIVAIASRQPITADLLREYRHRDEQSPPSAFMAQPGARMDGSRRLRLRENGVAVLAIRGPMVRHADLFDEISGATSMATMAQEIQFSMDSKDVKSLVLDIESPGGEIPAELAGMIREADSIKPITAYVSHWGMSSAYWIGTAAGRMVAHPTAFTGSVGVRATFVDTRAMEESLGIQTIEMMSSQSPHKVSDPATDEGRARIQALLDSAYVDFRDAVAHNLGVARKKVQEEFGKGDAVHARKAVDLGMVHGLDTMEGVIAAVGGGRRYKSTRTSVAASGGSTPMARTIRQVISEAFGHRLDEEIADDSSTVGASHHGAAQDSDDPAELRRQLQAANARADAAEKARADEKKTRSEEAIAAQERDIKAQVKSWIGKKIDPAEAAAIEKSCLTLAKGDRAYGTNLLSEYQESIEARPTLNRTDEMVATGKLPNGATIVNPPVAPEPPEAGGDPWSAAREKAARDASPEGRAALNGTIR